MLKYLLIFLLFLNFGYLSFPCVEEISGQQVEKKIAPTLPTEMIAILEKNFNKKFSESDFKLLDSVFYRTEGSVSRLGYRITPIYLKQRMADSVIYNNQNVLRIDIEVNDGFRGGGLYYYILKYALDKFPNIEEMPARFNSDLSDNALFFIKSIFTTENVSSVNFKKMSKTELIEYRKKIHDIFYKMPAMKVRGRLGFLDVPQVTINMARAGLAFTAKKGPQKSLEEFKIYIYPDHEITKEGEFVPIVDKSVLELKNYIDFEPW